MESDRSLVIDGSFESFSKVEVFEVVGLSRQCMEVIFDDADESAPGKVLVKAGRVLEAEKPPDEGGKPAFFELFHCQSERFRVYSVSNAPIGEPIGTLADLIREACAMDETSDILVMEGLFADFSIDEVLDVLALSRSTMEVRFLRDDATAGVLRCKAGMVLQAHADDQTGRDAFLALFVDPGTRFLVHRVTDDEAPERLGSVHELVTLGRQRRAASTEAKSPQVAQVMEGAFSEVSIDEVLQVISLSRQVLEVVLSDDAGTVGTIVVKSGQLMDAVAIRQSLEGVAAFSWLVAHPGTAYSVLRRTGVKPDQAPLGHLATLTREAAAETGAGDEPEPASPAEIGDEVVVAGSFADFSMDELLDVLALSRQALTLNLSKSDAPRGHIRVKAGHVLSCRAKDLEGLPAFVQLYGSPGTQFEVRRSASEPIGDPLGTLPTWLDEAKKASRKPRKTKREILMSGSLDEFSLVEVMEVVSLSRQLIEVSLRANGKTRGAILVKSGQLLMARMRTGNANSKTALQTLIDDPGEEFVVLLASGGKKLPEPFATVRDVFGAPPSTSTDSVMDTSSPDDVVDDDEEATLVVPALDPDATVIKNEAMEPTKLLQTVDLLAAQLGELKGEDPALLQTTLEAVMRLEERLGNVDAAEHTLQAMLASQRRDRWLMAVLVGTQFLTIGLVLMLLLASWI